MGLTAIMGIVATIAKASGNAPAVMAQLIELQNEAMKLNEENRTLKEEVRELKAKLDRKQSVVVEDRRAWVVKPDGSKEGPYCSKCWEGKQLLSHMDPGEQGRILDGGINTGFQCPQCDRFVTDHYDPPAGGNMPSGF